MLKPLLLAFVAPFVLAAVVCVAPFACLYFLFDRLCDLIEEFKPRTARRKKPASKAAQLSRVLSLIPKRGLQPTTDNSQG
jgi:hypothetical protein